MPDIDPELLVAQPPTVELNRKPPIEITEKHKEDFFKAFLADKPYEEEFPLLGGKFSVKFKTLTMQENGALLTQIAYDRDKGRIEGVNDYYFSRVAHYRLSLSLMSINDSPFGVDLTESKCPTSKDTGTSFVSKRADLFQPMSMVKMAALQTALQQFDQRVIVLVDAIADPNFWKAAA